MTKSDFIKIITVLQKQHDLDVKHHKALCEIYGAEDVAMYDNSFLVNHLISQLQKEFPVGDDGECDIERFIYTYDFGRITMAGIKNAEELWEHLNKPKLKGIIETATLKESEIPKTAAECRFLLGEILPIKTNEEESLKRYITIKDLVDNKEPKEIAFNLFNELTSRFSHHNILSEAFFDIAIHEVESILLCHPIPVNPDSNQIEFHTTWKNVKIELIKLKESYKNANTN